VGSRSLLGLERRETPDELVERLARGDETATARRLVREDLELVAPLLAEGHGAPTELASEPPRDENRLEAPKKVPLVVDVSLVEAAGEVLVEACADDEGQVARVQRAEPLQGGRRLGLE